jgi:hypothetical protein
VATVVLWVRSYDVADQVGRWTLMHTDTWTIEESRGVLSSRGGLVILEAKHCQPRSGILALKVTAPEPLVRSGWIKEPPEWPVEPIGGDTLLGFDWVESNTGTSDARMLNTYRGFLRVPYWFIVATTAALPTLCFVSSPRRAVRRRRATRGLCPYCGYDLRATPGRCPECGTSTPL